MTALILFVPFPTEVSPPWRIQVVDATGSPVERCVVSEVWSWTSARHELTASTDADGWAVFPRQRQWFSLARRLFGRLSLVFSFHGGRWGPVVILHAVSPQGLLTVSIGSSTPGVVKEGGALTYRALLLTRAELDGLRGQLPPTPPPVRTGPDLGVWKRLLETPWKEYGTDCAVQHVLFTRTAPDIVTITIRTDAEERGRVIVRLEADRSARYCPVREGKEVCNATIVFDDRRVTFTFDDPQRLPEQAVLATPNMFVHSREAEGVKFEQETYASDAFDQSAAVRQAAYDSMQRYKRGVEEVQRRTAAKGAEPPSK